MKPSEYGRNFICKQHQEIHLADEDYQKIERYWDKIENAQNDIDKYFTYLNISNEYFYHDYESQDFYKDIGNKEDSIKCSCMGAVMLNEDFDKNFISSYISEHRDFITSLSFDEFETFYSSSVFSNLEKLHNIEELFFNKDFIYCISDNHHELNYVLFEKGDEEIIIPEQDIFHYFHISEKDLDNFSIHYFDIDCNELFNVEKFPSLDYEYTTFKQIDDFANKVNIIYPNNTFLLNTFIEAYNHPKEDILTIEIENNYEKYMTEDEKEIVKEYEHNTEYKTELKKETNINQCIDYDMDFEL